MADEIQVSATLSVTKGALAIEKRITRVLADMDGDAYSAKVQDIGHSAHEQVVIDTAVAAAGWCWFRNLDAGNYVQIGVEDGSSNFLALLKLLPGEAAVARLATTSIYAQADTATVPLEIVLIEE